MGSGAREGTCMIFCVVFPLSLFHSKFQLCWTTIWQAPHDFISLLVCHILRIWFLLHYSWNLIFQSLASQVRKQLHGSRMEGKPVEGFNHSTSSLLARYLAVRPFSMSSFPILTITTKFISKEKKIESTYTWFILFVGPATHPLWQYRAAEGVAWDVPHSNC